VGQKNVLKTLTTAAACVALIIAPTLSAQAATTSYWGAWSDPSSGSGTLTFSDPASINATYSTKDTDSVESDAGSDGKWLPESSPVGADWGATGPVDAKTRLRLHAVHETPGELNVVFDENVSAGSLAIAVSDVDGDAVTISAKDDSGNDLSFTEINGTVQTQVFNFCTFSPAPSDCSGDTDVPVLTNTATSVTADGSASNTEGATVWFVPSAAVKSIKFVSDIHGAPGEVGHHDFYIAEKPALYPVAYNTGGLAQTGGEQTNVSFMVVLALMLVGGGAVAIRRL